MIAKNHKIVLGGVIGLIVGMGSTWLVLRNPPPKPLTVADASSRIKPNRNDDAKAPARPERVRGTRNLPRKDERVAKPSRPRPARDPDRKRDRRDRGSSRPKKKDPERKPAA